MLPAPTLGELLRAAAREAPAAEAFRYRDESLSYEDWDELSDLLGGALYRRGVRPGDVVALLLPSTPLYLVAYLAAARIGAVTAGINARYRRTEIGHILRRSGAKVLIAVDAWHDADFRAAVETEHSAFPELREIAWVSAAELQRGTRALVEARFNVSSGDAEALPPDAVEPDDAAAIIFTSGTTGIPKGAWYTHRNLLALAAIDTRRYRGGAIPFRKHLAAGLSFAHIGTMARIAIQIGHTGMSIIHDSFDPAAVLAEIERERLQHLGGIPTQILMLLDHPERAKHDISSLRTVLLGGAPSSPSLIRRVQQELGVTISIRYSSTEVGIATASLPEDSAETLCATVGKATEGVELRIVDAEDQPLPVGEVGRVAVRSPATMRGYWRDPEATAATIDTNGWIRTGDLGFLDAEEYLHLRGRESEMFIRGGYNVYPAEVEDRLAKHPQVARAAVLGVPHDKWGEAGWAYIVPRSKDDVPKLDDLRRFVGTELASFKRPDGITIVSELPLTPMFKVDKRALRAQHQAGGPA